jgi:PST family polysaccharide transporter
MSLPKESQPQSPSTVVSKASRKLDAAPAGDLNREIARGGAFTLFTQAAKFGLRIVSMAILARLLTPADFGLIAMVTVVTGFVEMFKDSGMAMATIQRREITHEQISTMFWINVALSVGVMLVKAGLAPAIAWFYDEPRLLDITLVLAAVTVFSGLSIQHQALMRRRMQFGRIAAIEIGGGVIGIVTAVVMAYLGFGYWSLVGMTAGGVIGSAILSFALSNWFPGLPSRAAGVGSMVRFGANLAGAHFFGYLIRNTDSFIVGYLHGTTALGVYSRGYALFLMPMQQFLGPISSVVVPALSRLTQEPARFRETFLEKGYFIIFNIVVLTGFIFAAAPEIVRVILGPGWEAAAVIIRCLSFGGIIAGTNFAGGWIATTHGWPHRQFRVSVVASLVYALAFIIGGMYGPVGVASAYSIACFALRYPALRYLCKDSPIRPSDILGPVTKVGVPVAIAATCSIGYAYIVDYPAIIALFIKGISFVVVLAIFWRAGKLALPNIRLKG